MHSQSVFSGSPQPIGEINVQIEIIEPCDLCPNTGIRDSWEAPEKVLNSVRDVNRQVVTSDLEWRVTLGVGAQE